MNYTEKISIEAFLKGALENNIDCILEAIEDDGKEYFLMYDHDETIDKVRFEEEEFEDIEEIAEKIKEHIARFSMKYPNGSIKVSCPVCEMEFTNFPDACEKGEEADIPEHECSVEKAIKMFTASEERDWEDVAQEAKEKALELIGKTEDLWNYDWSRGCIIDAEIGAGWQEYEYENGTHVPQGAPVAIVVPNLKGEWHTLLFGGIYFSSEPDPSDKWIEVDEILEEFGVDKDDVPEDVYESMLEEAYGLDAEDIKEAVKDILESEGVI